MSDITLFFVDSTVVLDDFFFINSDLPETLNKTIFLIYLVNEMGQTMHYKEVIDYMKLEGKYIDQNSRGYNNHTGPTNSNDFSFLSDTYSFSPSSSISINMNINNWYNDPIYDLNIFGSGIMSNNDAQTIIQQNASDVFTVTPN